VNFSGVKVEINAFQRVNAACLYLSFSKSIRSYSLRLIIKLRVRKSTQTCRFKVFFPVAFSIIAPFFANFKAFTCRIPRATKSCFISPQRNEKPEI